MAIFLKASWENIIMANYAIPAELLLPYLPAGTSLDYYEGKTYVSLVGFMFKHTKLFNIPIPYLGTFEEINLRFYVTAKDGDVIKKGVVFINETIPYPLVAWVANKLYKEHYTTIPTTHNITKTEQQQKVQFNWQKNKSWYSIAVEASLHTTPIPPHSLEAYIYERYYGFTKINEKATELYTLQHPSWQLYTLSNYSINCNFAAMYGANFSLLNNTPPTSVLMAKGSNVAIEWKRNRLKINYENH